MESRCFERNVPSYDKSVCMIKHTFDGSHFHGTKYFQKPNQNLLKYGTFCDDKYWSSEESLESQNIKQSGYHQRRQIDSYIKALFQQTIGKHLNKEEKVDFIIGRSIDENPDVILERDDVFDQVTRIERSIHDRKKRFMKKAYNNPWNYFVTFTYDDKKFPVVLSDEDKDGLSEEEIEKLIKERREIMFSTKLLKLLQNLATRKGYRYALVWERSPLNDRLHAHCLMYIPDNEMLGEILESPYFDTEEKLRKMAHINTYFLERFGRNDFIEIDSNSPDYSSVLSYETKYIAKCDGRIIYSRHLKTDLYIIIKGEVDNPILCLYNKEKNKWQYVFCSELESLGQLVKPQYIVRKIE